jgi:hypothetical protein
MTPVKQLISKKTILVALGIGFLILLLGGIYILYLRKAHRSFENYYAFRGCRQLIEKTPDYGICKTATGDTIKIVKYQDRWFLDGDLPWACVGKICFGI